MKIKTALNNIPNSDWLSLKREWQLGFVDYQDVGKPPTTSILDLLQYNKANFLYSTENIVTISLNDCKTIMLREAIFLAHKACAMLRSYSRDIEDSDQTCAEIPAYTSAFFFARSITMVLGCFMPTKSFNKKYWMVEARSREGVASVNLMLLGTVSPGHFWVWELLKKLVANTDNTPFDSEFSSFISQIETRLFSEKRNLIQYHNCSWIYDDLHFFENVSKDWIEPFSQRIYLNTDALGEGDHFPVILSMMLFRAFDLLLKDISNDIHTLSIERGMLLDNAEYCDDIIKIKSWLA